MKYWKKEETLLHSEPKYLSTVKYINTRPSAIITELKIICAHLYVAKLGRLFTFKVNLNPIPSESISLETALLQEDLEQFGIQVGESNFNNEKSYKDREEVIQLINFLSRHESSIDIEFRDDLLKEMSFKKPERFLKAEINRLIRVDKLQDAINLAANTQNENDEYDICYEAIWELAELLNERDIKANEVHAMYKIYSAILPANPHYPEAQKRLLNLLDKHTMLSEGAFPFSEAKFKCAINSNEQLLADRYFNELCGNKSEDLEFKDVKLDTNFLIILARKIKSQNEEILKLKLEQSQADAVAHSKNITPFWQSQQQGSSSSTKSFSKEEEAFILSP